MKQDTVVDSGSDMPAAKGLKAYHLLSEAGLSRDEIVTIARGRLRFATESFETNPGSMQWCALVTAMRLYQAAMKGE